MGRSALITALVLVPALAGCQRSGREQVAATPTRDAGSGAARLTAPTPVSGVQPGAPARDHADDHGDDPADLGPEGRKVVECPVRDRLALDAALDVAAQRYDKGDYDVALACADRAAAIDPRNVEAHHDRAIALAAVKRWEDAKQAFTLALAIDPDDPETLAGAADFYINRLQAERELTGIGLELAQRGSAKVGTRRRTDKGLRDLAARLALLEAQALDDLARADDALPRAEAAVALDPDNLDARYERAVILFHLCRFDKARAAFTDVLARAPDDAFAHHHLGLIMEREGRAADADAHFARAHALAPDKFAEAVLLPLREFQALLDGTIRDLDPATQQLLDGVAIEVADVPALEDLTAVDPPFAPTILGLYRGAPLEDAPPAKGAAAPAGQAARAAEEPRSIVLYRKNLARAVSTRAELEQQVRITLWHEIGHLRGHDEDDLRARGLE